MGALQEMYAELNPYMDIDSQLWKIELVNKILEIHPNNFKFGNRIYKDKNRIVFELDSDQFDDIKLCQLCKLLTDRNISNSYGWFGGRTAYVAVGYNFKKRTPSRKNSHKPVIVE